MRAPPSLGVTAADCAQLLDDAGEHQPALAVRHERSTASSGLVVEADVGADAGDVDQPPAGRVGDAGRAGEVERGPAVAPEHGRRDVGDEPVGEPGLDQGAGERGTPSTSAWSTPRPASTSRVAARSTPVPPAAGGTVSTLAPAASHADCAPSAAASVVTTRVGAERGVEQRAVGGDPAGGVEEHPQRLAGHRAGRRRGR